MSSTSLFAFQNLMEAILRVQPEKARILPMEPVLDDLMTWARSAGAILREGYGKNHQISHKGRIDLVTEMDRRSEEYLIAQIRSRFPEHSIEAEESGITNGSDHFCWYIDPLDGTTNYAHAIPAFTVSIAVAVNGALKMGVVYEPMRDECFAAQRGCGATLNGEPIHVSSTTELVHSLLVTGFPYDASTVKDGNIPPFIRFMQKTQGVRRIGSAALDLCYVAAGRFDGYWELALNAYDMAAGALIVEEAGGKVTSIDGDANYLKPPFCMLAANPVLHPLMEEEFRTL
jgi:myo-inositol-1(or 4)-monophosphatase